MSESVVWALTLLVAICLLAVVSTCSLLVRQMAGRARDERELRTHCAKMEQRLAELSQVDFVDRHLKRYGVGGYLVTANERIAADVEATMKMLGLDERDAISYLVNGVRANFRPNEDDDRPGVGAG